MNKRGDGVVSCGWPLWHGTTEESVLKGARDGTHGTAKVWVRAKCMLCVDVGLGV